MNKFRCLLAATVLMTLAIGGVLTPALCQPRDRSVDTRFRVAGVTDDHKVISFMNDLRSAIKTGNRRQVATMILYPITIRIRGNKTTILNESGLLQDYDEIINDVIVRAVECYTSEDLIASSNGIMLGNGELWIAPVKHTMKESPKLKIIAINNSPIPGQNTGSSGCNKRKDKE